MIPLVFALFGLVIGSFLTVVVYRVPRKESIVSPRSRCPSCGKTIPASQNIPVVSWLLLRGRCANCGERISPKYPLIELATAALFAGAALRFDYSIYVALVMALFLGVMLAVSIIDIDHGIIPNRIIYPALPVFAMLEAIGWVMGDLDFVRSVIGFLAYGGFLLIMALIAPRAMGMGDVKLVALIGLVLGGLGLRFVWVAAAAGVFAGGIGGIGALLAGRGRKQTMPFGPYLAAGASISVFAGAEISRAYLNMLS
ncbi:MAG: prepilin peptidase [Actinomycetota bacterium]